MSEKNVVHTTVGVLFDLYTDGLIKKETFDALIEAYKDAKNREHTITVMQEGQIKTKVFNHASSITHTPEAVETKVESQAVQANSNPSTACSKKHLDDIINDIVRQMNNWERNRRDGERILKGIDHKQLLKLVNILRNKRFMSAGMFEDLIEVITYHKEMKENVKEMVKHSEPIKPLVSPQDYYQELFGAAEHIAEGVQELSIRLLDGSLSTAEAVKQLPESIQQTISIYLKTRGYEYIVGIAKDILIELAKMEDNKRKGLGMLLFGVKYEDIQGDSIAYGTQAVLS